MRGKTDQIQEIKPLTSLTDTILVPQGAEYRAVCRGLYSLASRPAIVAIPVGIQPVTQFLDQWQQTPEFINKPPTKLLLMGLCGSLSPHFRVGDGVMYLGCLDACNELECDAHLSEAINRQFQSRLSSVKGVTSDRVISAALEKQHLGKRYQAEVVDMEGMAVLDFGRRFDIPVAMLRVVSDDCQQDLPDLTGAFTKDGQLNPLILTYQMIKQPFGAWRLIRSSLQALQQLKLLTRKLFS